MAFWSCWRACRFLRHTEILGITIGCNEPPPRFAVGREFMIRRWVPGAAPAMSGTPNKKRDHCTWLIYVLTIEGSYLQDIERPAIGCSDTYQCWITPHEVFDVRTFAIDKDVRILKVDCGGRVDDPIRYFQEVALETYGDIIA